MGTRTRVVVGAGALVLAFGLAGCGGNPVQQAADAVTGALGQVDALAVSTTVTQAVTAVTAYAVTNMQLPATISDTDFVAPEGISVKIVPTGGLSFSILASAGKGAFKGDPSGVASGPSF